ncbi:MAG: metal-dependent transcriptional regulator [Ferruginibacter sp.]|nr:metal-dependent transcriptional regulator [Ferruginibacter sp.]
MNFSVSEENYIKSIYHLQQQTDLVTTNSLANELQTRPASVTDMLKKLQVKKILEYEKYKGFRLNASGKKVALSIVRRHRLWEYFLVTKLGFEWDKVHAIAEELEHVSSPELIRKLDDFLNHPTADPHGDPIPDMHGKIAVIKQLSIADVPENKNVVVSSVSNQSPDMLELLKHYHIGIGTGLKVTTRFSFDGSVEIKVSKYAPCIISELVAKNIFVYHD